MALEAGSQAMCTRSASGRGIVGTPLRRLLTWPITSMTCVRPRAQAQSIPAGQCRTAQSQGATAPRTHLLARRIVRGLEEAQHGRDEAVQHLVGATR